MEYIIKISEKIDSIVNTREAAHYIKELIEKSNCSNIQLDFENVEFISRSFADQMHKEKIELLERGILIDIVNANNSIMDMFNAVSNTQYVTFRKTENISIYKITANDTLSDYLHSI